MHVLFSMNANKQKNTKKEIEATSTYRIGFNFCRFEHGMSLLEVILVLAILMILGGYAMSSYHRYHERGYRLAAITAMYEAAFYIEKIQEEDKNHVMRLPADLKRSPRQGVAAYRVRIEGGNPQNGGYSIIAEPLENGPMRWDKCGRYRLDATGQRSNGHQSQPTSDSRLCWLGRA